MAYKIRLPKMHKLQEEIFYDKTRFKVIACGRRWGKTFLCVLICLATAFNGKRVWWVAHNYSTAGIAWRLAIGFINQIPKEVGIKYNIAERTINFTHSGGEFYFKSSDRPDNLRGEGLDLLVMDEADFHKKMVWEEILRPTLTDRKGSAIFISTPKVEGGWFHKLFKEGLKKSSKNIKSWQLSSYTNPYLDPEELDEIREVTPDLIFRREFLAEFVSNAGARVSRDSIQSISIDDPEIMNNKNLCISIGVDLAIKEKEVNDYTAICIMARDMKTQRIYILDIFRERMSFRKQKEKIKEYALKWNKPELGWPEPIIGIENNGYQEALVQEMRYELPFTIYGIPSINDKIARFASMEADYELEHVFHVEGLPLSFDNELCSFPEGDHDDYVDSESNARRAINIAYGYGSTGNFEIEVLEHDENFDF